MKAVEKGEKTTGAEGSLLVQSLGSSPKLRMLDFLLDNRLFDFSKKEIIEGVGMSKATFYKYWSEIEENELVKKTRKFGNTTLYTINEDNPVVQELIRLDEKLMEYHTPE